MEARERRVKVTVPLSISIFISELYLHYVKAGT
jgi:hypothetical protein